MNYNRWDEWDGLLTEGNKIKHEQWNADWRKIGDTWTMKSIMIRNLGDKYKHLLRDRLIGLQKHHHSLHYLTIFLSVLEGSVKGYNICESHITI